jgi:hypothetical protein
MKEVENLYSEKVNFPPKGTFELAKDAKEKKKPFVGKTSGPEGAEGVKLEVSDPKDLKGKETFQGTEKLSSQNFNEKIEKSEQKEINNFMSKSIFDKLFEDVMGDASMNQDAQDAVDLGIGAEHEGAAEEGGDVTFTLPRDLAQKLCDVLHEVLETSGEEKAEHEAGAAEADAEEAGSEDAESKAKKEDADEDEDAEEIAGEATEMTELKPSAGQSLQGKSNKVGGTVDSLVSKSHGEGKVKGEVDGKGKPLGKSPLEGQKNNKVANKLNVGDYLFKK